MSETPVIDAGRCGVFAWQPSKALVEALSDVLDAAVPCTVRAATIQQQNTATSPDSNEHELPPTPTMSWGSGQTPSGAASSGRRGRSHYTPILV